MANRKEPTKHPQGNDPKEPLDNDTVIEKIDGKKDGKKNEKTNEDPLLSKMREIMVETLNKSLGDLHSKLTKRIDALEKSSNESIGQFRGEVKDKFDYLEDKLNEYKSTIDEELPKVQNRLTLLEGKQSTHQLRIKELGEKYQETETSLE